MLTNPELAVNPPYFVAENPRLVQVLARTQWERRLLAAVGRTCGVRSHVRGHHPRVAEQVVVVSLNACKIN